MKRIVKETHRDGTICYRVEKNTRFFGLIKTKWHTYTFYYGVGVPVCCCIPLAQRGSDSLWYQSKSSSEQRNTMRVPCIPYKGSKAKIAMELISAMPPAESFVDLFCGGGAMTSAAILSGKYRNFILNDISNGLSSLYVDMVHGKPISTEWVSREHFMAKRNDDPFIRYV